MEQKTLKEEAIASELPKRTLNIADLPKVSTNLKVSEETFLDSEQKEVTIKVITIDDVDYRVPQSVLNNLKAILEDNPNLEFFKVKKTGEGMDTRYTVIPLK